MSASADALLETLRMRPRSKYLTLISMSVQRVVAYRGTTFMNLITGLISLAVAYYLWLTIYGSRPLLNGMSWDQMRTYIVLAYAINAMFPFFAGARVMWMIRDGAIAVELLRPVDFMRAQLAQSFGSSIVEGGASAGVAALLGVFLFRISGPVSAEAALLFFVSIWLGFLIKFLIGFMVSLIVFWTLNWLGVLWAQMAFVNLFSGALIPLQFFPDWLQTIAQILPFQAIIYTPVAIYLGQLQDGALALALGHQLIWVALLWGLARLVWTPAIKALNIQGG